MIQTTFTYYNHEPEIELGRGFKTPTVYPSDNVGELVLSLDYEVIQYIYHYRPWNRTETPKQEFIDKIVSLAGTEHVNYLVLNELFNQKVYFDLRFMEEPETDIHMSYTEIMPYGDDLQCIIKHPYTIKLRAKVTSIKLPEENKKCQSTWKL